MLPGMMRVLTLPLLLLSLVQAAPKDGATRLDPEEQQRPLANPFQPGPEWLRLLQSYLRQLGRMQEEPEHMSREEVLLYLFALHDYDKDGQLDGLELLSMLTAALAPGAADSPPTPVILVVDKVLETQDLDGDGLLTPAELITFPGEAPGHAEPRQLLASAPQEPQAAGRQPLLAKSPLRQTTQEAPGPREAGGQEEDRRESLGTVQEAGHQTGAEGDALGPGGEARGQVEAGGNAPGPGGEARGQVEAGDAPGPREEVGGQAEARDNGGEAKELLGETLDPKNTLNELEVHSIQLENDEI